MQEGEGESIRTDFKILAFLILLILHAVLATRRMNSVENKGDGVEKCYCTGPNITALS
jgi:hypothetical protein